MTTYCVWFDNFLQELFAIEKYEFDQYEKLEEYLKNEKNTIHLFEADSLTEAFSKYKQMQEQSPALSLSHTLH